MTSSNSVYSALFRNWLLIAVVVVVAVVTGYLTSSRSQVKTYTGSVGITIRVEQKAIPGVTTAIITDQTSSVAQAVATVETWISDPSVISAVLIQSNQSTNGLALTDLSQKFTVIPSAANAASFQVQSTGSDVSTVSQELTALTASLTDHVAAYNLLAPSNGTVVITATTPITAESKQAGYLTTVAAFAAGCVIALLLVVIVERKRKS